MNALKNSSVQTFSLFAIALHDPSYMAKAPPQPHQVDREGWSWQGDYLVPSPPTPEESDSQREGEELPKGVATSSRYPYMPSPWAIQQIKSGPPVKSFPNNTTMEGKSKSE